jgi:conjugal transfer mating pair stabilization protein TraG
VHHGVDGAYAFQVLPGPGQLSADLSYQKHGLLFGNSLIKRSREATFPDPNFRTDLVNFIANCTMYDLADGTLDPAVFARSTNLWGDMATPNPARFSTITIGGTTQISPCPAVYTNLDGRRAPIETQLYNTLASQLNPICPRRSSSRRRQRDHRRVSADCSPMRRRGATASSGKTA